MERLVFALAFVEIALACSPVPQPEVTGKGSETAKVTIVINDAYNPSEIQNYMNHFPQTDIEQYSEYLGDFDGLTFANVNGYFAYVFILHNCVCYKVELWLDQIVNSSTSYKNATMICPYPPTTTTTTTAVTTTTAPIPACFNSRCKDGAFGTERGNATAMVEVVSALKWNPAENNVYKKLYDAILTPLLGQVGCVLPSSSGSAGGYFMTSYMVGQTSCKLMKSVCQKIGAGRSEFRNITITSCLSQPSTTTATTTTTTSTTTTTTAVMDCPSLPKPLVTGRGNATAQITIGFAIPYNSSEEAEQYNRFFQRTNIEEYSADVGDFTNLTWGSGYDGYLTYSFTINNCDCGKISEWENPIAILTEEDTCYVWIFIKCPSLALTSTTTTSPAESSSTTTTKTTSSENNCGNGRNGTKRGDEVSYVTVVSTLPWDPTENDNHLNRYNMILTPRFEQFGCMDYTYIMNLRGYLVITYVVGSSNCTQVGSLIQQLEPRSSMFKNITLSDCS